MSRPQHAAREEHVLKIKVWQAVIIALAISIEVGMGVGWILHATGH